ncbi:hypothetical protein Ocin01_18250 [Orchesella cincta]|uniref:Uncharacterized protein n=1 Tax=Orchesella cincta TaxID=48709 RepID=A0A1D2M694_ORCCI|nr:hypothetical protein Ocin01_18250 [Orchesella cincta]
MYTFDIVNLAEKWRWCPKCQPRQTGAYRSFRGRGKHSSNSGGESGSVCYDRDKQSWTLEADTHSDTLRVRMVYKDVHNVPRNHLRYVSWSAYLLRYNSKTGLLDPISCTHAPYSHYYVQEEVDDGIIMETDVTVKEVRDPNSFYLNDKRQVRIQIEWGESYLLFQATYHKYDDVTRMHNFQMRREIGALQAENYSLERQLFSYQKSIAYAHAHQHPSTTAAATPATRGSHSHHSGENSYESNDQHHRPFLDRGVSTDTEYA